MEDEQEDLKDSSVLEEEYANLHEVFPQPMHVFTTEMEEINDEDDLLDEFDTICSSIDIESSSLTHKEHVLQQQEEESHTIPVAPKEVAHEHHEKEVEIIYSQAKVKPHPNQQDITKVARHNNKVKADCLDLKLSIGCPIRHLDL